MNYESFFKLSYGLYLVASEHQGNRNGYVANTVFQVTAEPPQLGISCSKKNMSTSLISGSGKFSVSVLKQQASPELIGTFGYRSGRSGDKFSGIDCLTGKNGCPVILQDAAAWFNCEVTGQLDTGTHIIFVGKVIDCEILDDTATPMTYAWYREVKKGLSPENAPTYVPPDKIERKKEKPAVPGKRYQCLACNFIYDPAIGDPDSGIAPGTAFEDIPDNWKCPVCGATKDMFEEIPG